MRSTAASVVGSDAERVRNQLNQWRHDHGGRGRIPEVLWAAATRLASEHGLHKTARLLGLNYYGLKKRLQAESGPAKDGSRSGVAVPATTFFRDMLRGDSLEPWIKSARLQYVVAGVAAKLSAWHLSMNRAA